MHLNMYFLWRITRKKSYKQNKTKNWENVEIVYSYNCWLLTIPEITGKNSLQACIVVFQEHIHDLQKVFSSLSGALTFCNQKVHNLMKGNKTLNFTDKYYYYYCYYYYYYYY